MLTNKTALVTGASRGIGAAIAKSLAKEGAFVIINYNGSKERANAVAAEITADGGKAAVYGCNVSDYSACEKMAKDIMETYGHLDILVNNAGFGLFGNLWETDLQEELELLDVNIRALHILTKLFVKEFRRRNSGILLNVASSAGFLTGPLMASYYASKNYVVRLSLALAEELRRAGSSVSVSVLCPGPVDTNFNNRAGVSFHVQALDSKTVARYAIDGALHGKTILVPGLLMKLSLFGARLVPQKLLAAVTYHIQEQKQKP